MDASVLRKRIYKLLIFSILMVLGILLMAFLFINHADDSLNKATYTTMDQEIDLCVQRVSSKKNTDLVLLNTFARNLNKETDLDSSLFEMKKESDFSSIQFIDMRIIMCILQKRILSFHIIIYQMNIKIKLRMVFWGNKVHLNKKIRIISLHI